MRDTFVNTVFELAEKDPNVVLLIGDIGGFLLQSFERAFPDRFLNMGIAEANMVGVASGLAMNGKKPYLYTITPFMTARPYEQVKNDVCYPNLNIKLVGVGSGIAYTPYGPTHHSIDDLSLMRTLPNMTVVSPADPVEVREALHALLEHKGPAYLRLGLNSKPLALGEDRPRFRLGRANVLREGKDAAVLTTGDVTRIALEAAERLSLENISVRVVNISTIKPLDKAGILSAASETQALITFEEHSIYGGLGSAVAEVLAEESRSPIPFKRIGIRDVFCQDYGSRDYLLERFGLSVEEIIKSIYEIKSAHRH